MSDEQNNPAALAELVAEVERLRFPDCGVQVPLHHKFSYNKIIRAVRHEFLMNGWREGSERRWFCPDCASQRGEGE